MIRTIYCKRPVWRVVLAADVLFGILAPSLLLVWQACTPLVAVQKLELGTFVSSTASSGGAFSSGYTSIQTTLGTVTVEGVISAPRGQKLALEVISKIDGQQLCVDGDLQTCIPLASPWLGSLKATPQADTAIDFQRFGLTTSNVDGWFGIGVMLLFMVFIAASIHCDMVDDVAADKRARTNVRNV